MPDHGAQFAQQVQRRAAHSAPPETLHDASGRKKFKHGQLAHEGAQAHALKVESKFLISFIVANYHGRSMRTRLE
jgi:hypothetical protein